MRGASGNETGARNAMAAVQTFNYKKPVTLAA